MLEKTRQLLREKDWPALSHHISLLRHDIAAREIRAILGHIQRHFKDEDANWVIPANVWHVALERLASIRTSYSSRRDLAYALDAIDRAMKHRGPCVLEKAATVLHRLRRTPFYDIRPEGEHELAQRLQETAEALHRHPQLNRPIQRNQQAKEELAEVIQLVREERQTGRFNPHYPAPPSSR